MKSATYNGKLSWTSTNTALWWVPDNSGFWTVGSKTDIGTNATGELDTLGESVTGPPYGNGDVWWYVNNAGNWNKPVGEITVECTTFTKGQSKYIILLL